MMISEYKYSILLRTTADIAEPIKAGEKALYEENFQPEALILFILGALSKFLTIIPVPAIAETDRTV